MTNTAMKLLYNDLREHFNIKYILTYRLNQDVLENFFATIRVKGGLHDHPDPLEFRYRLRSYILGRNEGTLSSYTNVADDLTPGVPDLQEQLLSGQCFSKLDLEKKSTTDTTTVDECEELKFDGLQNLAGFICHKLNDVVPSHSTTEQTQNYTWTTHLSEGGLSEPSLEFMGQIQHLENIFSSVNGDSLLISTNYLKFLENAANEIEGNNKVKTLFFRSRMYFRIRQLNQNLRDTAFSRKRKMKKTVN